MATYEIHNQPKPIKTSQNQSKPPKTSHKQSKPVTITQNHPTSVSTPSQNQPNAPKNT